MPKVNKLDGQKSARHLFGKEMRDRRLQVRWSQEVLGKKVGFTDSHISRIENAESMPPPELVEQLDQLFDTDVFTKVYGLARTEQHPDKYQRRMELEAKARRIEEYAGHVVPGLVQTREYAHELFREANRRATSDDILGLLAARMSRQDLLRIARPAHLSMILDEAVLRRPIGGPVVMRAQLAVLAQMAAGPDALVQVLPFSHGAHPLLGGSLAVFTFGDGSGAAYEESIATGTLLEAQEDVAERRLQYDEVRAHALSPRSSEALIREAMEALST
ncbi:Scr1 family TA system antitoxin-like transcriptional regulator [Streptomyces sp. NPDC092296]|uniref:helix-turn-helix domain-containing protein n=1 Tax=Streptomyces sp. NPDC092296 TaxID=3366012 RepID=UPI0038024C9F